MDYKLLSGSLLFQGLTCVEIQQSLDAVSYHVEHYNKGDIVFHSMDEATRIGIILSGKIEAQKTFPNGSQVNVTIRTAGELIGPAAAFSSTGMYPCDVVSVDTTRVLFFRKQDLLRLMALNERIMQNITQQLATAAYMLQRRLELFSYNGISQKIAFFLLMHCRQSQSQQFIIPDSMTKWAMMMNVSRPSLHRELKKMADQGTIRYAPPVIEILNKDTLHDILA